MNKIPVFQGSCTAIVTPFCEKGIDYERLQKQLDFQLDGGTAAIVVCGTTGENATLSQDEHNELVRFTVNNCKGRMKVIVGVGGNNTVAALRKAENAKAVGADAILMVTPYYNKTSQKGLIEHFSYVADRVEIPMILYNVPSRTGIGITAETYKAAPFATLDVRSATVTESAAGTVYALPVHVNNATGDCTVTYAIEDITAKNGLDYTPADASAFEERARSASGNSSYGSLRARLSAGAGCALYAGAVQACAARIAVARRGNGGHCPAPGGRRLLFGSDGSVRNGNS